MDPWQQCIGAGDAIALVLDNQKSMRTQVRKLALWRLKNALHSLRGTCNAKFAAEAAHRARKNIRNVGLYG